MNNATIPTITRAHAKAPSAAAAVAELREQLPRDAAGTLVFCSPEYDLQELGPLLRAAFDGPVVGCTSAGGIGPGGYVSSGITAVSFCAERFTIRTALVERLSGLADGSEEGLARAAQAARELRADVADGERVVALLLVDGLSGAEELLSAELFTRLVPYAVLGGSAGDDRAFQETFVLHDGRFRSDAAVLLLLRTALPLAAFKHQHHVSGERTAVVTHALPGERRVLELNGNPAAEEYARMIGVEEEDLGPALVSVHPLAVRVAGEEFLRSIREVHPDGSLSFYCAIDRGVVLRLTESRSPVAALEAQLDGLRESLGGPIALLCFDCVLRRLEFERNGELDRAGALLDAAHAVGFSTYGEQYDALHVNQTLVGLAFRQDD